MKGLRKYLFQQIFPLKIVQYTRERERKERKFIDFPPFIISNLLFKQLTKSLIVFLDAIIENYKRISFMKNSRFNDIKLHCITQKTTQTHEKKCFLKYAIICSAHKALLQHYKTMKTHIKIAFPKKKDITLFLHSFISLITMLYFIRFHMRNGEKCDNDV